MGSVFGRIEKFFEILYFAFDFEELVFGLIELNPCSFFELTEFNDLLADVGCAYHKSPSHLNLHNTTPKDKCI